MEISIKADTQAADVDFIMSTIRDYHRQLCRLDPDADVQFKPHIDSTIDNWMTASGFDSWKEFGIFLNEVWNINKSELEWKSVLYPTSERRLGELCEHISRLVVCHHLKPVTLFGCQSMSAAAFLSIKSILSNAGADMRLIKPSSALDYYTNKYIQAFLGPISRLAPESLPLVTVNSNYYSAAIFLFYVGTLCTLIGVIGSAYVFAAVMALLSVIGYTTTWLVSKNVLQSSVKFGNLHTFRDAAVTIANGYKRQKI